jgi:hypothetical protein
MRNATRLTRFVAPALLAGLMCTGVSAQGEGRSSAAPQTAQAAAAFDITGYWVAVITQDWRLRMVMPPKGDYMGFPMTVESKKVADAWNPARDEAAGEQCKGYGAAGIMRLPTRLHVTWQDANTLRMDTDFGTQTRVFHFGEWKSPRTAPSWQGDSVAGWAPRRGLAAPSSPKARGLKVVTTNMRPAYLRRNGVPYSAQATLTEYFDLFPEPDGDMMIVTTIVEDPVYLYNPLIVASHFKKEPNGAKWDPTPCSAKW